MILRNLNIVGSEGSRDISIEKGLITAIFPSIAPSAPAPSRMPPPHAIDNPTLSFEGALAFPGLINSHDHLDFNLFPPLANRVYNNYTEWGPDIQKHNRQEIDPVLKIPEPLRTRWGIYKNLLNGVTTVVNHGARLKIEDDLINVFQDCHCLHSVGFEKNWKWKINRPRLFAGNIPFVLHVGEGTDETASREIDQLIRWNMLNRPLIGVHGVSMNEEQAAAFKALVWCPATNYFLLGRTAPVVRLKTRTRILFGTDSTLTAGWNIWEQIRLARKEGAMTDPELLETLTRTPAAVWGLPGRGELAAGKIADLVVARPEEGLRQLDAFFSLNPENILLVLSGGEIRLFDPSLLAPLTAAGLDTSHFYLSSTGLPGENGKYVRGDLPGLIGEIGAGSIDRILFPSPLLMKKM